MLEKTLESPSDCKEIQPVHPKGNQSWVFIGRTDAEAEAPVLCPSDVKSWLIWNEPDAGKDWGQEEKGTTEDEMVGWHHRLSGHKFEQTPGNSGQESLVWCSRWNCRVGHDFVTEQQQQQGEEKSKQPLMALRCFEERILTAFVLRNLRLLHLWKQSCHQLEYNTRSNEPVCSPRCQRNRCLGVHIHLVKALVFPVVMYGCESWTVKKAERRRIDAFELWCWRRLLRVPRTARRSNQSIPKEISPECSLEGLMLKLKLQYFVHLMWRADSFEKTLMLGKIEGWRKRGRQRMR